MIVEGLRRLEYRGYDSAGVAVLGSDGRTELRRAVGKLKNLDSLLKERPLSGRIGLGHTRWATHGRPSEENAHPHHVDGITVIHNGIIENYLELRRSLQAAGRHFSSETDTEIMAHLVATKLAAGAKDLTEAVRGSLAEVRGAYAFVILSEQEPGTLVTAKSASPIVLGYGEGESFIASDIPACLEHTRNFVFLEDGQMATVRAGSCDVTDLEGHPIDVTPTHVDWSPVMAEKGGHKHFMHKEIYEQPTAVADTIRGRVSMDDATVHLDGVGSGVVDVDRFVIGACGTSWHAGLVGKFMIESLARVPVEVDLSSEFRYRNPVIDARTGFLAISQSGETADTLAAVKKAKADGAVTFAICNVIESSIARECKDSGGVLYTHAGPEIGVASTKAFVTQLAALYLLAIHLGRARGTISVEQGQELLTKLREVPSHIESVLNREASLIAIARRYARARDFLFLGRGPTFPIALEGALKLKELSYIHAEGYAAGEMKHGPIALVDDKMPVVGVATGGPCYEKTVSNLEEVKARDGRLIIIAAEGDRNIANIADDVFIVPRVDPLVDPLVSVVPLQLLAYHVADLNGTDVDQPRNLA
ncbi:MAG: glutamine--fructose-6-phosphate transaminase (isomerizing), partial [Myxococcota bacterium]